MGDFGAVMARQPVNPRPIASDLSSASAGASACAAGAGGNRSQGSASGKAADSSA